MRPHHRRAIRFDAILALHLDGQVDCSAYLYASVERYGGEEGKEKAISIGRGRQLGPYGFVETHTVETEAVIGFHTPSVEQRYYY